MSTLYDIAVIGAGPAGTAAAITAARFGVKVLLLDRDSFPRPKVCGEFVSAEAIALLARLLGSDHALVSDSLSITRGRLFLGGRVSDLDIHPSARSIPRYDLDHALWQAAQQSGVDARSAEAVRGLEGDGPFNIHTTRGDYQVKAAINATGRWSGVCGTPQPPRGHKWLGLKAHYRTTRPTSSVDLYFFRYGYCGVQPVIAKGVVNVCAMVRSDVAKDLEEVFAQHAQLQAISRDWQLLHGPLTTAPLVHAAPSPTNGQILHVGDAAGFIDPFLGDGISLALHTGVLAAQAASSFIRGEVTLRQLTTTYAREYDERFAPAFRKAARLRRLLSLAQPLQPALAGILKTPYLAEWILRQTRPRPVARD